MATERPALVGVRGAWLVSGHPEDAPIRDGAVVLDGSQRVVAVGPGEQLAHAYPSLRFERMNAILTPGLVNAHVHLELSALRGQTQSGGGFGPWASSMMARRDVVQPESDVEAIDAAVSELLRAGTAAIGEVTNTLASVDALASAPLLGRVFHELFGMSRDVVEAQRAAAARTRERIADWPVQLDYVLAPHTLYTLPGDSVRALVEEARASGQRTSVHLSEHAAERTFLHDGSGPFATFLAGRRASLGDFVPPGLSPVAYAQRLNVLSPALIAVHLTATDRDELASVAASGAQAVLCPRSNLYIELKLPPLYDVLAVGLRPGLGTDSLASNTTLDVLAEAAALRDRFPSVAPGLLFAMASWYGAVALGLSHRVGALRPGLSPGLLAFELAAAVEDPYRHLLRAPPPARKVLARPALPKPGETLENKP
jgi:aminodeoxyfutalosine deaminase